MKAENTKHLDQTKLNMDLQEALAQAGAYIGQLQRILWLTVQAAGGTVTLDEATINPLWRLDKRRVEGTNQLELKASITPPPTKEQLTALINKLAGTSLLIDEVQDDLGLGMWPQHYLAFQIRDQLMMVNEKWCDATLARHISKNPEAN